MADHDYHIIVDFNNKDADGYNSPFSPEEPTQPESGTMGKAGDAFANLRAFSKAIPGASLVKQTFDWQVSLVGRYTGSQDAQQKASAAVSIAEQVGGIAAGIALGGVTGGLLSISAIALGYMREIEQNSYDRKWENISNSLRIERAGPSLNRSRREN